MTFPLLGCWICQKDTPAPCFDLVLAQTLHQKIKTEFRLENCGICPRLAEFNRKDNSDREANLVAHRVEGSGFPRILEVGLTGVLINFSDHLTEASNRAALSFRARIDRENLEGVVETTTSLTSAFVVYDPVRLSRCHLRMVLDQVLREQDWSQSALPVSRKLWRIPAVFEGSTCAPQLAEAAELAGISVETAISQLCDTPLRVLTLGFAPGQPYLGSLAENWNIPRQTGLTKQVPAGAITGAIRQIVLFANPSPTGWRQVGQCAFQVFRPKAENPFALSPGDEVVFYAVDSDRLNHLKQNDKNGDGGASWEPLP